MNTRFTFLPRLIVLLALFYATACSSDTSESVPEWQVGEEAASTPSPMRDMSTRPDQSPSTSAPDLSKPKDEPAFRRPDCAPKDAAVGGRLQQRWADFVPDTPLLVHVASDWLPGQMVPEGAPLPRAMMEEIKERGIKVLARPIARSEIKDRSQGRFSKPSNDRAYFGALVQVTPGELVAWMETSCAVKFVWLSGFDCQANPQSCDDAKTCNLFHRSRALDPVHGCLLPVVGGCEWEGSARCDGEMVFARDPQGACWVFDDACVPASTTVFRDETCEKVIEEARCAFGSGPGR